jgi:mRNA interferase MazF
MAARLARGDVRLFRFPEPDKPRPVLIVTRPSAIKYLSRVTVAPITSTIRGVPSEVVLDIEDGMKQACAVNLHNVVTVPQAGLGRRLAQLGPTRMKEICEALNFALGCEASEA